MYSLRNCGEAHQSCYAIRGSDQRLIAGHVDFAAAWGLLLQCIQQQELAAGAGQRIEVVVRIGALPLAGSVQQSAALSRPSPDEERIKAAIDEGKVAVFSFGAQGAPIPCLQCQRPHVLLNVCAWKGASGYLAKATFLKEGPLCCPEGTWEDAWDLAMSHIEEGIGHGGRGTWTIKDERGPNGEQ